MPGEKEEDTEGEDAAPLHAVRHDKPSGGGIRLIYGASHDPGEQYRG